MWKFSSWLHDFNLLGPEKIVVSAYGDLLLRVILGRKILLLLLVLFLFLFLLFPPDKFWEGFELTHSTTHPPTPYHPR